MDQQVFQLKLPEPEIVRLYNRVITDYRSALTDHRARMARWAGYYRRWRSMVNDPIEGEEEASNFPYPYIRENVLTALSKHIDAIYGDDAEIVAVPVGPSNYKRDAKISKYMTWRVFNSMKLQNRFIEFETRKLIFGRSIAWSPWKRDVYEVLDPNDNYSPVEIVDYEGPEFLPLWPDDLIAPAEDVRSVHEFSWVVRKYRTTPGELLQGEVEGRYQNVKKNWDQIVNISTRGMQRDFEGDDVKIEKDIAEGVLYQRPLSAGEWVTILEWYGRWRPLKRGARDADEHDFKKRDMKQKDFVVRVMLDLPLVLGVQDLQQLYPIMRQRRPFVESSLLKDGSYWCAGMGEMLLDLEDELAANYNQGTEGVQMAIQPPIGYRPATGMTPETIRIEPGLGIPLDNPQTDMKQIEVRADLSALQWKEQTTRAVGERLTGHSDLQMGRQPDRPNAPKTAAQTNALLEEGNVRISLDTKILQEDMAGVLAHFWELEYQFSPDEVFFRVTEEDADGLFAWKDGGSILSLEDRDGRYDFRLKFANSVWSRELKKQQALARYQLDLQNPLIVNNPQALWETTNDAHDALGDPNFADIVPKPPAPDVPIDPKEEWVKMLHGETVTVNPLDNDQLHLIRHYKDMQDAIKDGNADPDALVKMVAHYHQQIQQLEAKKMQQAVIEQGLRAMQQVMGGASPAQMPNGLFGGNPGQPSIPQGDMQATGPFPFAPHPEVIHEQ